MPTIAFVLPAIGKKPGQRYIKTWQLMEPLTIATLKALTPPDYDCLFYDDRIELVDIDTPADLVAITTEVYTARRAYDLADAFRARGKTVVLGGYHASLNPEEAAEHADCLVVGNAETVWPGLLADWQTGRLRASYSGDCVFSDRLPDRSIFAGKKYSAVGVVETGRGCNFGCEFCAISAFYRARYHRRPVEQVLDQVRAGRAAGKRLFFFADDNIVADPEYAIELFKALAPLHILWSGQGSLTMARNPELLYWMRKSGCTLILIGYESLDQENLRQMNKAWSSGLGEVAALTVVIHRAGLNIYATFVFGFDNDDAGLFERTERFAEEAGFYFAAFNHLLPMPGTPLHHRLAAEGRLELPRWWLEPGYLYGRLVFRPRRLSADQVSELCRQARKRFYRLASVLRRGWLALCRNPSPLLVSYFYYLNFKLGQEVDEKMYLPIGQNLDELPK